VQIILDRKALASLFEDDQELQIKFKKASIDYVAKHFLKEVAPGEIQEVMHKEAKSIMKEAVGEMVRAKSQYTFVPSEKIKGAIKEHCFMKSQTLVREIIESLNIPKMIDDIVQRDLANLIKHNIDKGVKQKFDEAIAEINKKGE